MLTSLWKVNGFSLSDFLLLLWSPQNRKEMSRDGHAYVTNCSQMEFADFLPVTAG